MFDLLQRGTKAPQAAGRIHTDFEKGFIMAEVMKFDDFKEAGSENACKVLTHMYILVITGLWFYSSCSLYTHIPALCCFLMFCLHRENHRFNTSHLIDSLRIVTTRHKVGLLI